jgi:TolB-like protein/DNA-binding winged helix-turn-helix (wHTH) protein/Flp pilus assembly protein TadD
LPGAVASKRVLGHYSAKYLRARHRGFTAPEFHFADYTLDQSRYRLQRGEDILRLEKRPMELLILLVERRGELVSREEIAERLWGKDVFLDVDRSINTAISKVRVALRDDPDNPRFVETVVGKGYRFAAPVTCNGDSRAQAQPLSPAAQIDSSPAVVSTQGRAPSMRLRVLVGAAVLALFAVTFVWMRSGVVKGTRQPAIKSLAVLPLKNLSGDPTQEYLADGMTEELIGRLAGIHNLRVISRTSVMRFKDTQVSVPEIGKTLGVDAVVEGSVIREGNTIRVHAQLIRAATDEHFWSESYDRDMRDVLALQSDVAQAIARKVEVTVSGEEHNRLAAVHPVSPEVYEDYLRGRFALAKSNSRTSAEESIPYFNEAIRKDPTFAPSYMGLADAYAALTTVFIGGEANKERPKATLAARKALEFDPELVQAHVLLADMAREQWRWAEAEAEYRRALELSPNYAEAHSAMAFWLVSQGRAEEAVTSCRRARELDPLAISGSELAWMLFYARRYDDAVQELRSVLAVDPDDAYALWILGFALIANHHPEGAVPVLEKGVSVSDRSPAIVGLLAHAYAQAGRRADALRLLEELKRRKQTGYVPAAAFVKVYLGLGDYDQAFFWLEEAYKEQSNLLQFLKVHPIFDPIRHDPRFADLVRRVGLPR